MIRGLEEEVKRRLRRRAKRHGQSLEAEVRDILRHVVREESKPRGGLGSRIAAEFVDIGLTADLQPPRGLWARPLRFNR